MRKFHRETAGAEIMPKLLAKQHLNIRLVVNHENEEGHARAPGLRPTNNLFEKESK